MAQHGVSDSLLPLVILTELGGGLLVALGLLARPAAVALAGFCLLTAYFFHTEPGNTGQLVHLMKNLAIAGGFFLLSAYGPGDWSLDVWLRRRRRGTAAAR